MWTLRGVFKNRLCLMRSRSLTMSRVRRRHHWDLSPTNRRGLENWPCTNHQRSVSWLQACSLISNKKALSNRVLLIQTSYVTHYLSRPIPSIDVNSRVRQPILRHIPFKRASMLPVSIEFWKELAFSYWHANATHSTPQCRTVRPRLRRTIPSLPT